MCIMVGVGCPKGCGDLEYKDERPGSSFALIFLGAICLIVVVHELVFSVDLFLPGDSGLGEQPAIRRRLTEKTSISINRTLAHDLPRKSRIISSVNDKTFFPGSSRLPGTTSPDGYFGYFHAITYLETSSHIFAGDEGGLTSDNGGSIYYFQP